MPKIARLGSRGVVIWFPPELRLHGVDHARARRDPRSLIFEAISLDYQHTLQAARRGRRARPRAGDEDNWAGTC